MLGAHPCANAENSTTSTGKPTRTKRRMPSEDSIRERPPAIGASVYEVASFGTLWISWSDVGVTHLTLPGGNRPLSEDDDRRSADLPKEWRAIFDRYFAGEVVDFSEIPVDLDGSDFQIRVWEALRRVPHGKVRTYAGIASDIGSPRAMRAVGMANAKNPIPIVVPCHRILEQGNKLGGFSGGLDVKRYLLRLDGARIEGDDVLPGQLPLL
jgi:methylated-DNA-[protein]-cysteine S-methyltransferase